MRVGVGVSIFWGVEANILFASEGFMFGICKIELFVQITIFLKDLEVYGIGSEHFGRINQGHDEVR